MLLRARIVLPLLSSLVFSLSDASQLPMNPAEKPLSAGEPSLYDLLTIERRATIFADYVRSLRDMTGLLNDRNKMNTLLVPTNKAVLALARKPYVRARVTLLDLFSSSRGFVLV